MIKKVFIVFSCLVLHAASLLAQDLDPRAYARVPIDATTLIWGYSFSKGGVVTDPTLPLEDLEATVHATSLGVAHSFSLFGLTAQALAVMPISWASASARVNGQPQTAYRSGLADMRLRVSVLLLGAPAATVAQMKAAPRKTVLGVSMNVVAPTGQVFEDKLVNIGTNRWSFRPEVALSQPIGQRWLMDVYAGIWLFTDNTRFYPGNALREQDPMGTFQAHLSYNFTPITWVALDATFYTGGQSSVDNKLNDDRQSNTRIGATFVFPVGKQHFLRFAVSRGAIVRIGQNFTTASVGWQRSWIKKPKKPVSTQ
jgi:hypothetical protein